MIPVTGEPELPLQAYAADRAFAYLRLHGDDNSSADRLMSQIGNAGAPCLSIDVADTYALAGEFYRWEYATAVAGAVLGVNPFDQPDVQRPRDASSKDILHFVTTWGIPYGGQVRFLTLVTCWHLLRPLRLEFDAKWRSCGRRSRLGRRLQHRRRRIVYVTASAHHQLVHTALGFCYVHRLKLIRWTGSLCAAPGSFTGHPDDLPVPRRTTLLALVADSQALGDRRPCKSSSKRRIGRIVLEDDEASQCSRAFEVAF